MRELRFVPTADRWTYRELLLLADPEEAAVARYLSSGEMYVLQVDGKVVCEAVMHRGEDGECELMNLATREEEQGKGYAGELIRRLMTLYSADCSSMLVGTSAAGRGYYRRLGFQDAFVRKGFFLEYYEQPIYENGARCVDMYCLRVSLPWRAPDESDSGAPIE